MPRWKKVPQLDRRVAIVGLMQEALGVMDDYSFCEVLYSVLRKVKPDGTSVGWVRDVKDEDFYSAIDLVIEEEKGNE